MTAAVGWAVVGPYGVATDAVGSNKRHAEQNAEHLGLAWRDGAGNFTLPDGYRLARVRIEVIEESDDE